MDWRNRKGDKIVSFFVTLLVVVKHLHPKYFSHTWCVSLYPSVPNPPGPIEVQQTTTSSIDIKWTEAPLMSGASFQYQLLISLPHADVIFVNNTSYTFRSLPSGTPFNISVQTVGVMKFVSKKAQIRMVTTSEELTLKLEMAKNKWHDSVSLL